MYTLLRWYPRIPDVIVYDFACDASRYCKARSPLFHDTKFLIDEFHGTGHKCSGKYHIRNNRESLNYGLISSNVAEVNNKVLKLIKTPIRYMGHKRAFRFLQYFCTVRNEEKLLKYLKVSY